MKMLLKQVQNRLVLPHPILS